MSSVKGEIKEAIEILKLTEREIKKVNDEISSKICEEIEEYFTTEKNRIWLWENFKLPYISISFNNGVGYEYLVKLVPDVNEFLWFVTESDENDSAFLIYETNTLVIQNLIAECFAFEYYLIPKNFQWLICENHHNVFYLIGQQIKDNLENIILQENVFCHFWKK